MDEGTTISVTGLDAVQRALDRAPDRVVRDAVAHALAAASVPVVRELTTRVPVKTGRLAESVMTDIAVASDGKSARAQVGFGKRGFIARLVEYGHRQISHRPKKKEVGAVPAHPFMRPAAAASSDEAISAFARSMDSSLKGEL